MDHHIQSNGPQNKKRSSQPRTDNLIQAVQSSEASAGREHVLHNQHAKGFLLRELS